MKNSQQGFIAPLFIAIIALLVIGGGVYVYENEKVETPAVIDTGTQQQNSKTQPVNTQTSNSSSQTGVSNWRTYSNSKYGFSVQYPTGTKINDEGSNGEGGTVVLFTLPPSSSVWGIRMFNVDMETKAWYNLGTSSGVLKSPANCEDFNSISTSLVNIDGINFIKGDVSSAATAQRSSATEYCVLRGGIAYKLTPLIEYSRDDATQNGFNPAINVNNDSVLNQMLSTFKFTK